MQEQPTTAELLEVVTEFLRNEIVPNLTGPLAFNARVAANALSIAKREIEQGPEAAVQARAKLASLLGHDDALPALDDELCERIARKEMNLQTPGLLDYLWYTTMKTVAINQPNYSGYQYASVPFG